MPFVGIAKLKDDVTVEYKDIPIAIMKGTNVTLLKTAGKGYTAEVITNKDNQLIRIIFHVFKKELTELHINENKPSGTMPEPVYGEVSVQEP